MITKHTCGVVQWGNGKTLRLSETSPVYRATKMIGGKEIAYLNTDKTKVEEWLNENN